MYDAKALATLSGKALAKKRNHVNRFIADNPNYVLEPLTATNIAEVKEFLASRPLGEKADTETAFYELAQCMQVLRSYNAYPFEGGVLRGEDGRICAFTIGEIINDTIYLHIEKADHTVAGAGEAINKLFAAEMLLRHPHLRYINREEDAGDPGLRYAKESYHPAMLLKKFNVYA